MYSVRNSVSSLSSAGETAFSISKRPPTSILLLLIGCWLFLWSITLDEVGCWNQLIESAQLIRAVVKIKRSSQNSYVSTLKKPLRGRMVPKQKHLSGLVVFVHDQSNLMAGVELTHQYLSRVLCVPWKTICLNINYAQYLLPSLHLLGGVE